ncbi:MAG: pectate lyase, partial [Niabella sp.]
MYLRAFSIFLTDFQTSGFSDFRTFPCRLLAIFLVTFLSQGAIAQKPKPVLPVVVERGKITYNPDTLTGDRVPDFSYCGYKASEENIPFIPVKVIVPEIKGDATATIQSAIDRVAEMPLDKKGFRGAVLLSKGTYTVNGTLKIAASGIVVRGFGAQGQTVILGTGVDRDGLIRIVGKNDKKTEVEKNISQKYVPVGAASFRVNDATGLQAGDRVIIKRPSTKEWIEVLGTESFGGGISALGWKPGDVD